MTWTVVSVDTLGPYQDQHVVPVDDLRLHIGDEQCWCRPRRDVEDQDHVLRHQSMDGREAFEHEMPEVVQ